MDSPELTERFITLASMDNKAIVYYYRHIIVPIILRHARASGRLIDLGCAGGVLLTLLRERGFKDLYGIDAARVLLERIPDKSIPLVCDNYLNVRRHYNEKQFDAATIFNTLHHLGGKDEFCRFFENLSYILKPQAVVLVKELYNGLFRKVYYAAIKSKICALILPSVFSGRNFVEREEQDMHSRFFRDIAPNMNSLLEGGGKFKIIKQYNLFTFERLTVMERIA